MIICFDMSMSYMMLIVTIMVVVFYGCSISVARMKCVGIIVE